ncbi:MAG: ROK family protein [Atopobiaceae bacterium]|nr:ROK family protein [Olsenella sp.]MBQ6491046.1 ROK family protein [Atopobiaceae bacterium]
MSAPDLVAGIDIGGTNVKAGIVDLATNHVLASCDFPTPHDTEEAFLGSLAGAVSELSRTAGAPWAAGISIGSYVFGDGSIDGMSSFVPFLTHGYPLAEKITGALGLPVRVDNDARLICLAEARDGAGQGFSRVLTLTLGTGVGVGLCEDGHPFGGEPFIHLAGHVKVRTGGEYPCLDSDPCYCGMQGCFESTCSGTSLQKYVHDQLGEDVSNAQAFERAAGGDERAAAVVDWYLDMLARALNQYVYLYCPDVIVMGGGVAKGLKAYEDKLNEMLVAEVYEGQRTVVRITDLKEDSGILGAASLFA